MDFFYRIDDSVHLLLLRIKEVIIIDLDHHFF